MKINSSHLKIWWLEDDPDSFLGTPQRQVLYNTNPNFMHDLELESFKK